MTARTRTDLVLAAAASIAERQRGREGDDLTDAIAFATVGVIEALYPREAERAAAARLAFGDGFLDIEHALVDTAFSLGVAFGHLKAEG
jgi:hypothetical protein